MQIWAGLGNPGASYSLHRHNVGFMAADAIAEQVAGHHRDGQHGGLGHDVRGVHAAHGVADEAAGVELLDGIGSGGRGGFRQQRRRLRHGQPTDTEGREVLHEVSGAGASAGGHHDPDRVRQGRQQARDVGQRRLQLEGNVGAQVAAPLTFRCGGRVPTNPVRIGLSPGRSSTFYPRVLSRAGESLAYNLYRDAAGTQIWGDGTNGTFDVPMTFQANQWIPLTIYAEIPPSQDVTAGAYTDAITATINFSRISRGKSRSMSGTDASSRFRKRPSERFPATGSTCERPVR